MTGLRRRLVTTSLVATQVKGSGTLDIDTTKNTVIIHDGVTPGGHPLAKEIHMHSNATGSVAGFMSPTDKNKLDALSSVGGYATAENNAVALPQRAIINFGTDLSAVDNPGAARTDINISQTFRDAIEKDMIAFAILFS